MKQHTLLLLLLYFLGCKQQHFKSNFSQLFKHQIVFDKVAGAGRRMISVGFVDGKALILSMAKDDHEDKRGLITVIDINTKAVLLSIPNTFFDYQNLILSISGTHLYITENGGRWMYQYDLLKQSIQKIDIAYAAPAVVYGNIIVHDSLCYFLNSPYGSSVYSKAGRPLKNRCRGVVMSSDYATISRPFSNQLNLVTTCLNSNADSIGIEAVDAAFLSKWNIKVKYNGNLFVHFEMIRTKMGFLVVNDKEVMSVDYLGNVLWTFVDAHPIVQSALIGDQLMIAMNERHNDSAIIRLININLINGSINDAVELSCPDKDARNGVTRLSVADRYVLVQYQNILYKCMLNNLKDYSQFELHDDVFIDARKDDITGAAYAIIDGCIYW